MSVLEDIRAVVREHAKLSVDAGELDPHADLYQAGMTSHASVNVMLAIEDRFDIEFPDRMLTRAAFATMANIELSVTELRGVGS